MRLPRAARIVAVLALPSLLFGALAWVVYAHFRIEVPPRLSPAARSAAMDTLRRAVERGEAGRPDHPELQRPLADGGPVLASVWLHGLVIARALGHGETAADAVADAAATLADDPHLRSLGAGPRREARIKVDLVVGRGPLLLWPKMARLLTLHPGLEGLGVVLDGEREVLLSPAEMIEKRLLFKERPLSFVPDLNFGLDFERADGALAVKARLGEGSYGAADRDYFRFRADSFVERPQGERAGAPPLALTRGLPPGPALSASALREAALAGGRYLVAHLADNGRYIYQVDLTTGRGSDPKRPWPYSLPRHAGTTYFLAQLYRYTGEEFLREPMERAFAHLASLVHTGGCRGTLPGGERFACVIGRGQRKANLGSTALTVVALAEYRRATGDRRYDTLAKRLTRWILWMQRPDGSFAHIYDVDRQKKDESVQLLYFSGEAALALARMHRVYRDPRYLEATERALDHLVGWYDFFAGGFFYGEEHWTCIAAEAAWPALKHERYRRFCDGYSAFLRRQQPEPGEFPDQADLAGAYTFTPFVIPSNTPAGSRTEAMLSSYLLGTHHGERSEATRAQILAAMGYALHQQIRADSDWNVRAPHPHGAIPASPIDRRVRIDYVQHVCSAMIRTAALLDEEAAL